MSIRTNVQSLPICGYSFSKILCLDIELPRARPTHGQGSYPGERPCSKMSMIPLTRHRDHVLPRNCFPSSQPGQCLLILDVPTLSAISLEKARPRGLTALYFIFVERFCL